MTRQYQPRRFFRQVPNRLLKQCLGRHLDEVNFNDLTETEVEPIYKAWLKLPETTRNEIEQDFQEIDDLATESGTKAILDEARWHGEDLAGQFAKLQGPHEHAFWTFLERPRYWGRALAFHRADMIPTSFWRKRKNLPRRDAAVDAASIQRFEQGLDLYFHTQQGRGLNCKVDTYRRNDLDSFLPIPKTTRKQALSGTAVCSNAAPPQIAHSLYLPNSCTGRLATER